MAENKPSRKKGEYTLPAGLIRLHVTIAPNWVEEEDTAILRRYGGLKRGNTITRDLLVPKDITLSALHFTLQRALGFQNSHLHRFEIYEEDLKNLTGDRMENLLNMRGIIFTQDRGPYVAVGPFFRRGRFKKWLKKQYTQPYRHYNDYLEEFNTLDGEEPDEGMLLTNTSPDDLYCRLTKVHPDEEQKLDLSTMFLPSVFPREMLEPAFGTDGQGEYFKWENEKNGWKSRLVPCDPGDPDARRLEVKRLGDFPVREGFRGLGYESSPSFVIERLPLANVLTLSSDYLPYDDEGRMVHTVTGLKHPQEYTREEIQTALRKYRILLPKPFTDVLSYNYDFGDNWHFCLTGSRGASDLVEGGVITPEYLQRAIEKAQEEGHPVLLAKDGDMLIDDVGNISGFCRFLAHVRLKEDAIIQQAPDYYDLSDYYDDGFPEEDDEEDDGDWDEEEEEEEEEDENGMSRAEHLRWAVMQGWHRNDFEDIDLL